MMVNFNQKLIVELKKDLRFVDDDEDSLIRNEIINFALKSDKDLIKLLIKNKEIRETFFDKIEDFHVFNLNKFIEYVQDKNFLSNSYTKFKNKIGLNIDGKFLGERGEVSLVWPFKDCVLEGGMSKEDQKRNEIFFNEILAKDEIDRLFDSKVLINFKKWTAKGGEKVTDFNRDENGTITDNLIIKGNNLLALHSLKKEFAGKVKLIYIDPPYNTGNDGFKYNDNFNHSSWLTFMKNRLEVAKELLRDDGVIFVQCDDNEQAYLKVLMDDKNLFGRGNIDCFVWRKSGVERDGKMKNTATFRKDHEYIIVAFKNKKELNKSLEKPNWENSYPNPDNDPRGNYKAGSISKKEEASNPQHKYYYTVKSPSGKKFTRQFDISKEEFLKLDRDNRIYWGKNKDAVPAVKIFENEKRKTNTSSLILFSGTSTEGKKEIEELFGDIEEFATPKPEALMEKIIHIATQSNDIVLDFHLGSGTTCAVAHKMGRQYIGIEQMDYIENIAVERMKKVIGKETSKGKLSATIEDCDLSGISKSVNWQGGGNFIYCELKKFNEEAIDKIQDAKDTKTLFNIWDEMCDKYFLNYVIEIKKFNDNKKEFENLSLEQQKKLLCEMINKNQLYVHLSEIEDSQFNICPEDIELNSKFYGVNKNVFR